MYFGISNFSFIIFAVLWTCSLLKISSQLRLNYKRVIMVVVFSVACIEFVYQYLDFVKINEVPLNRERYKVKEAFFDYTFHEDRSAEAEHRLLFEENKKHNEKNTFSYVFYESGAVRSLEVRLNGSLMEPAERKTPNTYELQTAGNQHRLTLYLPYSASKTMDLQINYVAANALLKKEGLPVYYNVFFPERTDFSFNTNVKGRVTFHFPEASLLRSGAHAEGFWLQRKDSDKASVVVDFENKLFEDDSLLGLFSNLGHWTKYDPVDYNPITKDKRYNKDFSLTTRLDFLPAPFQESPHFSVHELQRDAYSVSELNAGNQENNKKFSGFRCIVAVFKEYNMIYLYVSFPFLFFYYHDEKRKEREKEDEEMNFLVQNNKRNN